MFAPIILYDLNTEWEKIFPLGAPVSLHSKQIACDTNYNGFYYVISGLVRLSILSENGEEKILLYIGDGCLFNENPAIVNLGASIFTCMEPTKTIMFSKSIMTEQFIQNHPDLILNLFESSKKKIGAMATMLFHAKVNNTFSNTCKTLCSMLEHQQKNNMVVPRLSQQELASLLGVHRTSLHQVLKRLQDEGIIGKYRRSELQIIDKERLYRYAAQQIQPLPPAPK